MTFIIRDSQGNEAEADSPEAALLAAHTLQRDFMEDSGWSFPAPTVTILLDCGGDPIQRHVATIAREIRRDEL